MGKWSRELYKHYRPLWSPAVGSRIRARVKREAIDELSGALLMKWNMTVEREGGEKPCCAAEWLLRYYE